MDKQYHNKRLALSLGLVLASVVATEVNAQDDDVREWNDSDVLEEVIVTARKRQETLQDTPVAVSAFTADNIKAQGIANTRDLQKAVPGLNFAEMGNKTPSIFIRGIGQKDPLASLDPGVGVYINGIYIARTDTQLLDTVDTQSIQVLRGPQGTLFGKNNTGGALLVTTQQPYWEEFTSELSTRIGNFGRKDLKLNANIPLNDENLAVRIGLSSTKREGYLHSYAGSGRESYGDEERLGATARLFWQNSDVMTTDLFLFWSKVNENGAGLTCIYQNEEGVFDTLLIPGFTDDNNSYDDRCRQSESLYEDNEVLINGPTRFTLTNQMVALTLSWELDEVEIKTITAWSQQEDIIYQDDSDGTDMPAVGLGTYSLIKSLEKSRAGGWGNFEIPDDEKRYQYSQEVQLIGYALDERLSYTVGVFAAVEKITDMVNAKTVGRNGYSYKADFGLLLPKILAAAGDMDNETYALFGQATYDVTDNYQLTIGLRYTIEKRDRIASLFEADCEVVHDEGLVSGTTGTSACPDFIALPDPTEFYDNPPDILPIRTVDQYLTLEGKTITTVNGEVNDDAKWTRWTPTITNAYKFPEETFKYSTVNSMLVYFTYSKGFKSGGFEMRGLEIFKFDPEDVTNYEIGIKIDALDERLRFNTAIYYMDYEDIQIRITEQGRNFGDILEYFDNAGEATITGIEMELTALPFSNFTLQFNTSYTDASYDEFMASNVDTSVLPPVASIVDRSAEDFVSVPAFTYNVTCMYMLTTKLGMFIPRFTLYYRDEMYTGLDSLAGQPEFKDKTYLDDVTLLSARLAFMPAATENFDITFFIDNIEDKDYFQGGFSNTESLGAGSFVKGLPRHYGFEAALRF